MRPVPATLYLELFPSNLKPKPVVRALRMLQRFADAVRPGLEIFYAILSRFFKQTFTRFLKGVDKRYNSLCKTVKPWLKKTFPTFVKL